MSDVNHGAQVRIAELFGNGSLTTKTGMDWEINGFAGDAFFSFRVGQGSFFENGKGQYFAGIPLKASVTMGDFEVVEEQIIKSPYCHERTYSSPNIFRDYAPSPDPDFACVQALMVLRGFSNHFSTIREKLAV